MPLLGWIKTEEMDEADQGSGAYSDTDIINTAFPWYVLQNQRMLRAIAFSCA
jgi:hypothetical protein